jgi:tRNA-dihydrouridine synthase B
MLKIGNIEVDRGILLAPMEDVTDPPFRLVCRRFGADIVYTEFISSEGLIRDAAKSRKKLTIFEEERPSAIQIFGGDVNVMIQAAQIAEEARPDFIDINCGCWVKNVVARNAGAGLLRDIPQMERMVRAVVEAVKLPVTVKTRLGWDKESIKIVEVAQRLEQTGIHALAIHCRVRSQGHDGFADWSWIPKVKAAVKIPIILNGDVKTPQDVKRAFDETGCDAVMIGRAAIQNPWVFQEAKRYLQTGELPSAPTLKNRIDTCLRHLKLTLQYKFPERRAVMEFRKYYSGYLHGLPNISKVRAELMQWETVAPIEERLIRLHMELENTPYIEEEQEVLAAY